MVKCFSDVKSHTFLTISKLVCINGTIEKRACISLRKFHFLRCCYQHGHNRLGPYLREKKIMNVHLIQSSWLINYTHS